MSNPAPILTILIFVPRIVPYHNNKLMNQLDRVYVESDFDALRWYFKLSLSPCLSITNKASMAVLSTASVFNYTSILAINLYGLWLLTINSKHIDIPFSFPWSDPLLAKYLEEWMPVAVALQTTWSSALLVYDVWLIITRWSAHAWSDTKKKTSQEWDCSLSPITTLASLLASRE